MYTFDSNKIDGAVLACERLLSQFENSKTGIQPFIGALVEQTQDLNDAELSLFLDRSLDYAQGVQLDIIGRIVGQPRPYQAGEPILYFQYDAPAPQNFDNVSGYWVTNAPLATVDYVPDSIYRRFIIGKIFKNHVYYCSTPEILQFIRLVFNVEASVQLTPGEVFAIDVYVEASIDPILLPWVSAYRTDSTVQLEYFLPIAAGVNLNSVTTV